MSFCGPCGRGSPSKSTAIEDAAVAWSIAPPLADQTLDHVGPSLATDDLVFPRGNRRDHDHRANLVDSVKNLVVRISRGARTPYPAARIHRTRCAAL
jgi:hypothetical protein